MFLKLSFLLSLILKDDGFKSDFPERGTFGGLPALVRLLVVPFSLSFFSHSFGNFCFYAYFPELMNKLCLSAVLLMLNER